jgi:hypothetical protein
VELAQGAALIYRPLFESSPLPMWVYDTETLRFLGVNILSVVLSYSEALLDTLAPGEVREDIEQIRNAGRVIAAATATRPGDRARRTLIRSTSCSQTW